MKCPNCERMESWEDASFCPRCGKQLISILTNNSSIKENRERENLKIKLQVFQIGIWIFLTAASFPYVSKIVPDDPLSRPMWALIVLIGSAFLAVFITCLLKTSLKIIYVD